MGSEQKRQKKLAKAKAKRKEKKTQLSQHDTIAHRALLKIIETCPVYEALVPSSLWTQGLGNLIISRKLPDGRIAAAIILVDVYCLGVKNASFATLYPSQYRSQVVKMNEQYEFNRVSPESFAKLIHEAIAYAAQFGFKPHPDFAECAHLLANLDHQSATDQYTFGKDGKPLYIRGPHESFARAQEIMRIITTAGGHHAMMLSEAEMTKLQAGGWIDPDAEALEDDEDEPPALMNG
jgi:hypothetical protein